MVYHIVDVNGMIKKQKKGEIMRTYIGIDPGVTGAIAVINSDGSIRVARHEKDKFSMIYLFQDAMLGTSDAVVALEDVLGICGGSFIGKRSAYILGEIVGYWQGVIISAKMPLVMVRPQQWQKALWDKSFKKSDDRKAYSRLNAMQTYPHLASQLTKVSSHDLADAVHIARYAQIWDKQGRVK